MKNSWSRDSFKKVVKRQVAWQASTYYVLLLEHQIVEESLFAKITRSISVVNNEEAFEAFGWYQFCWRVWKVKQRTSAGCSTFTLLVFCTLLVQTKKRPYLALCVISVFAKALIENESSEKCQRSQTQSGWKIENSISHGEWRRNTFAQMLVCKG